MFTRLKIITLFAILLANSFVSAQAPLNFPYQAVIRDDAGKELANKAISLKVSIFFDNNENNPVFVERHNVVSSSTGLISLSIGEGTPVLSTINDVQWGTGAAAYLKIEIDLDNSGNFVLLGSSPILSVPYALSTQHAIENISGEAGQIITYQNNKWNAYDKISSLPEGVEIKGITDQNFFKVTNSLNQTLFSINEEGVFIHLSEDFDNAGRFEIIGHSGNQYFKLSPDSTIIQNTSKGGFAVGGLSSGKNVEYSYFKTTPTETQILFNENPQSKTSKGGFAVGGLSSGKSKYEYLSLSPDSIRFYIDDTDKSSKGGFAVGGLSAGKAISANYLSLDRGGAQILFDETQTKSSKGGFAVGGLSAGKNAEYDYFTATSTETQILFEENSQSKTSKGGFAVGGLSSGKTEYEYFSLSPDSIRLYIDSNTANYPKTSKGGFAVGGLSAGKTNAVSYLSLTPTGAQILFDENNLSKTSKGGFAVGGLSAGKSIIPNFITLTPILTQFAMYMPIETGSIGGFSIGGYLNNDDEFIPFFNITQDSTTFYTGETEILGDLYTDGDITAEGEIYGQPELSIFPVEDITAVSALLTATIETDKGSPITHYGFVWDTEIDPTTENNSGSVNYNYTGIITDDFSGIAEGLFPNTTYYARAYAINAFGTGYTETVEFTTLDMIIINLTLAEFWEVENMPNQYHYKIIMSDQPQITGANTGLVWSNSNPVPNVNDDSSNIIQALNIPPDSYTFTDTVSITAMLSDTRYYVSAYLQIQETGQTFYANVKNHWTNVPYNDHTYKVIVVENQVVWFTENLKTDKLNDNTPIPEISNPVEWQTNSNAAYCWYNNDSGAEQLYGKLYNGEAAINANICPTGWSVPNCNDWSTLIEAAGGVENAGLYLKEGPPYYNNIWFNARMYGYINSNGVFMPADPSEETRWWVAPDEYELALRAMILLENFNPAYIDSAEPKDGYYIRCMRVIGDN